MAIAPTVLRITATDTEDGITDILIAKGVRLAATSVTAEDE